MYSTCAISLIRLAYLKQGPDFTFDNVPTSCWSIGELCCAIICACLPTLRPLVTKMKPQWMTSYARKSRKQTYGDASGHARYGGGTKTHQTDVKSSRARNTMDGSLALSAANLKNYSRLGDDDVERAMRMPVPLSPTYQKTDSSDSGSFKFFPHAVTEHEGVQMQQLPPRSDNNKRRTSTNEKAMEVLGMGLSKVGVSTTKVVGGNKSTASSKSGDNMGGIEVKRDIIITTTPRS